QLVIDRVTASRLGVAPTTIDNTLYDAFGQRQINTMYTQLNQYHVILEAQAHRPPLAGGPPPPVPTRSPRPPFTPLRPTHSMLPRALSLQSHRVSLPPE